MKKTLFAIVMLLVAGNFDISAQQAAPQAEKKFTVVKQNPITPVRNQASTGTCWCFATVSFLESELLRKGYKGDLDLSEMFIVSNSYAEKVDKYVRMNGNMGFGQGSEGGDAITIIKEHGIVPESIMTGLNYGTDRHSHGELASLVTSFAKTMATARSYTSVWKRGLKALIANYLGEIPETFEYNGKTYTPESYRDAIGLTNLDDYVFVTSFTHHPFYTQFAIEAPDNWRGTLSYNVTLDEMMQIVDNAINNGYTVAWDADVSESGFNRQGLGTVPDVAAVEEVGSDQARWVGVPETEKNKQLEQMRQNAPEMKITQELRQQGFDDKTTTDDHLMHIYGTAVDQNGTKFYMVKNSWGETGNYKGMWYVSDSYVRYKTICVLLHKDAIPAPIKAKLNLK